MKLKQLEQQGKGGWDQYLIFSFVLEVDVRD